MPQTKANILSTWSWSFPEDKEPTRADLAIFDAIENQEGSWSLDVNEKFTRTQIQNTIKNSNVKLNGKPLLKSNHKLKAYDKITLDLEEPQKLDLTPMDIPIEILFEDEDLIVVNKPCGMSVHPSTSDKDPTLVHALLHHIQDLQKIGDQLRPGIVHRIDKNTSGAVVVAKSNEAHRVLTDYFSKHTIDRTYWALCYGIPKNPKFKIESLIGRNPQDRIKMSMNVKNGKNAISHFELKEEYESFASWICARLETGRTHQIRVHLTSESLSLLGDPVYGKPSQNQKKWTQLPNDVKEAISSLPGQALHARELGFSHPISGKKLSFQAKPPKEFDILMSVLKNYRSS